MKKVLSLLLAIIVLAGCSDGNVELDRMMTFRASLLSAMGCKFQAVVTADYQTELYQFTIDCRCDEYGNLRFVVIEPESISGISGLIATDGGKLTFDNEQALAFDVLADGQISPVTAPWLLVKTLRSGYVSSCGAEDELMRVSIDDSYDADALRFDVWFSDVDVPVRAEVLWDNRRILSLDVANYEIV